MNKAELSISIIGFAFVFFFIGFILGGVYTTNEHIRLIDAFDVQEVNFDINETEFINIALEKAAEEKERGGG